MVKKRRISSDIYRNGSPSLIPEKSDQYPLTPNQRALVQEKALFQEVLRQMPSGVAIAETPSGKILMINESLHNILGTSVTDTSYEDGFGYGRLYHACYPDGNPYRPEELPLSRSIVHNEVVEEEEILILRNDGSHCMISVSSSPVCDRFARRIACVAVVRDITEKKKTEKALLQLNESLEQRITEHIQLAESRTRQLQVLASKLTQAEQRERRRLAEMMHDHLQQLLVAAKMNCEILADRVSADQKKTVEDTLDIILQSLQASRSLTAEPG